MATSDEIGRERQRVSEQLARLDAERGKLVNELNELEIAERVLTHSETHPEQSRGEEGNARQELRQWPLRRPERDAAGKRLRWRCAMPF
jgi:hypothetical protein